MGRQKKSPRFRGAERYPSFAEMVKIPGQVRVGAIIGGVGPLAHTDFERMLLDHNTEAKRDQDHPGYILVNGTGIIDRTEALKQRVSGDDSFYLQVGDRILAAAQHAKKAGFHFFTIICNTAHAWRDDLDSKLPIPWVPIMGSAVQQIQEMHPNVSRVGILGTDGTMMAGLYTNAVKKAGFTPINLDPNSSQQNQVTAAIYDSSFGVKATGAEVSDEARKLLAGAADYLVSKRGAEIIIGGCTEIPPALKDIYDKVPFIDPLDALADVFLKLSMDKIAKVPQ